MSYSFITKRNKDEKYLEIYNYCINNYIKVVRVFGNRLLMPVLDADTYFAIKSMDWER